ncbi:potassium channel family protein [[Clostridium] fimetarium]|uniref:Voltage-gated potassium channel n=1 Tax=[Clostridium] fimetarium TaxID=99656 RepID=A0A1I0N7H1_9FIRM|nr:potassium channel family protein [[Clostridium] fimetarium]SEV96366.1 voltage-gated potassium channel [[Clostridium] fimetarium]
MGSKIITSDSELLEISTSKVLIKNHTMNTIYEVAMGLLAATAVAFAMIDITARLEGWQIIIDNMVYVIFIIDYFTRLLMSKEKKQFIKSNIFDLIAIIPFNSVFRIFRFAKLTRLTKLTKLFKLIAYAMRLFKKTKKFFDTNGFKYIILITMAFIAIGGGLIHYAEGLSFQDGIWWAFVTASTVGYGDISPETGLGRFIATILMLVGIGMIGSLTSTITSYFLNIKTKTVKNDIIHTIKGRIDDIGNLSDEEIDDICKVLKGLNK